MPGNSQAHKRRRNPERTGFVWGDKMNKKTSELVAKVPEVIFLFWIVKIFARTLGETGGDAVSRRDDQPCPSLQERPPIGVIAPSQRTLVNAIIYKAPLKMRIPARTCMEFLASFQ